MSKGEIQYIADTLLIEKLLTMEEGITKQAGLVDMFRGAATAIQQQVAERVEREGVVGAIATYMAPSMLWGIWKPLGVLAVVADLFGVSVGSIMNGIFQALKPKIEAGKQLTLNEINSIGKSVAQSELGESLSDIADSNDLFYPVREIEANGKLLS